MRHSSHDTLVARLPLAMGEALDELAKRNSELEAKLSSRLFLPS
jgi:hypothetical protein